MAEERRKRMSEAQKVAAALALIIAISARRTARAMSSFRRLLRERLKAGASSANINLLIDRQYLARTADLADAMGVAYVKGYQRGIRSIKDKLGKVVTKRDRMNQHSAERGKFQQVAKAAGYSDSKIARIRGTMTTAARKALRKAAAGVKADVAKARARASAKGMNLGDSTKLVNKTIRNAGTSTNNPYHLETIYRTQINMEFNAGIWDASQSLIAEGKVWGFEYVTMGDNRVRPEHELLEGVKLPFGHPMWDVIFPPNGWNCVTHDALITCISGNKRADEVKHGDMVLTACGRFRPVLQIHRSEQLVDVYSVDVNGFEFIATPEHQVATRNGWIKLSDLKRGDEVYNLSTSALNNETRRHVHDDTYATFKNSIKALSRFSTTAAKLNAYIETRNKEINPPSINKVIMDPLDSKIIEDLGEGQFMDCEGGVKVHMLGRVITESFSFCLRHLGSDLGAPGRSAMAELLTGFLDSFGIQPVGNHECLTAAVNLNISGFKDSFDSTNTNTGNISDILNSCLSSLILDEESIQAGGPQILNSLFGSQHVCLAAVWLLSHVRNLHFGLGLNVDVKWAPVNSLPKKHSEKMHVITFSVGGDNSYVSNGIVSHNCRCSILQIFSDEPAARIRRPRKMPDIPDEFRFEPGTVFPKPTIA